MSGFIVGLFVGLIVGLVLGGEFERWMIARVLRLSRDVFDDMITALARERSAQDEFPIVARSYRDAATRFKVVVDEHKDDFPNVERERSDRP